MEFWTGELAHYCQYAGKVRSSHSSCRFLFICWLVVWFFMIKPVTLLKAAQKFDISKSQLGRGGIHRAIPVHHSPPLVC